VSATRDLLLSLFRLPQEGVIPTAFRLEGSRVHCRTYFALSS